jgi:hypothetical protein
VVLTQKQKFGEISSLGEKNKVARNQTKHYFQKKNPKIAICQGKERCNCQFKP